MKFIEQTDTVKMEKGDDFVDALKLAISHFAGTIITYDGVIVQNNNAIIINDGMVYHQFEPRYLQGGHENVPATFLIIQKQGQTPAVTGVSISKHTGVEYHPKDAPIIDIIVIEHPELGFEL